MRWIYTDPDGFDSKIYSWTVSLIRVPKQTWGQRLNDSKLLNMKINNKQKEMRYICGTI